MSATATQRYICSDCGYIYDSAVGNPMNTVPPGQNFRTCRKPGSAPCATRRQTSLTCWISNETLCPVFGHKDVRYCMAEDIDSLTVNYEEDGVFVVKELDRQVLSRGAWSTILFRYQEYDRKAGVYGVDKFTIRRYQKRNGQFQAKSKFNISSRAQAEKIIDTLAKWLASE